MDNKLSVVLGASLTGLFYLYTLWKTRLTDEEVVVIDQLWIYPIKSCKGIRKTIVSIARTGFKYDREFMLINERGVFLSQRTCPLMSLVETRISEDDLTLIVTMKDHDELHIPLSYEAYDENSTILVSVWGDYCEGVYCGDETSDWFSKALNIPNLKLLRFSKSYIRKTDQQYAPNGQVCPDIYFIN